MHLTKVNLTGINWTTQFGGLHWLISVQIRVFRVCPIRYLTVEIMPNRVYLGNRLILYNRLFLCSSRLIGFQRKNTGRWGTLRLRKGAYINWLMSRYCLSYRSYQTSIIIYESYQEKKRNFPYSTYCSRKINTSRGWAALVWCTQVSR